MMQSKKSPILWLAILWVIAVIIVAGTMLFGKKPENSPAPTGNPVIKTPTITTFEECIKAGYPVMESYPRQCKAPNGITYTETINQTFAPEERITKKGKLVCLPHKNPGEVQTMECAYGLLAEDNKYYSLNDTDPEYKNISTAPMNEPVQVTGKLTLKEDRIYASIGVIDVVEITKALN